MWDVKTSLGARSGFRACERGSQLSGREEFRGEWANFRGRLAARRSLPNDATHFHRFPHGTLVALVDVERERCRRGSRATASRHSN